MGLLSFSSAFPSFSLLLPRFRPDPKSKQLSLIEMRQSDGNKKKKGRATLVRLVSSAGTGFFYVAKKTKNSKLEKLRKFDPVVRRHVLFNVGKMTK